MSKNKHKFVNFHPVFMAVFLGISGTAMAQNERPEHSLHPERIVYGKVVEVTPVYRHVQVSTPVKECWSEPVTRRHSIRHGANTAGSTLAGGLIGGIIGHQFGKGRGNKLATAVGTLVGAQLGHDAAHGSRASAETSYLAYQDVCEVENRITYETLVDGYRVKYKYKGDQYQTMMPYDPGKRIKLKMSVEPLL